MNDIKGKLMSIYESSKPQVFSQLHIEFDNAAGKISTSTRKIYDLRAGAEIQILIADGILAHVAIECLQDAIRHLEVLGLPEGSPKSYPDGSDIGQ